MTKKDYQLIARVFAETKEFAITPEQCNLWNGIVTEMAHALETTNGLFNPDRFYAACKEPIEGRPVT
jgi:hypothetical protein